MAPHFSFYAPFNDDATDADLHIAVLKGQLQTVKQLLNNGIDVYSTFSPSHKMGSTPLHLAVENGNESITELLLSRGAHSNCRDRYGNTPLHLAVMNGHLHIAEHLLNYGADVNAVSTYLYREQSYTPLYLAVEKGNEEITRLLLVRGAHVYFNNGSDGTPLHIAAMMGHLQIAEHLLNYGADINCAHSSGYRKGYTPLHFAVEAGKEEITKLLLDRGARIDFINEFGGTPLHIAARMGHLRITGLLLAHGADINWACPSGYRKGYTPLHLAVQEGHDKITKFLLSRGAHSCCTDRYNETPLHIAAMNGHFRIAEYLLNHGADLNSYTSHYGSKAYTPLHLAVEGNNEKVVGLLLDRGAHVNCMDMIGGTPLHTAASKGYLQITEYLLIYGADVSSYRMHCTPLLLAAQNSHKDVVKLLLLYKADVNAKQGHKFSILDIADLEGFSKVIKEALLKCEEEIEYLKSGLIGNSKVTFYDILTKSVNQIAVYANNENIVQILNSDDYKIQYPLYASMINSCFKKGIERKGLLEQSSELFHSLFKNFHRLPEDCTYKILSFLNDGHLKCFVDASK